MAGKSINIDTKAFEEFFGKVSEWTQDFFATMTQYEMISLIAMGVGLILLIVGLIML